jgi:hypothetical protein
VNNPNPKVNIGMIQTNSTIISNTENLTPNISSPVKTKRVKQLEKILSQKLINITELKSFAWKGLPFGK